jgi:triacylglycerol lipase
MAKARYIFIFFLLLSQLQFSMASPATAECVVLLHGLWRVSNSMGELEKKLAYTGYSVANISYPSRRYGVKLLAEDAVNRGLNHCRGQQSQIIHFVTHSLGGILVREFLQDQKIEELGRVVMLGPPNQGSVLVDELLPIPGFAALWGPTGRNLGTAVEGIIAQLGPVDFELGIIAGTTNVNPLSVLVSMGPNDSVVSVNSTKVKGMTEHRVLPVTHTFMMRNNEVIDNAIHFLKTGMFIPE